MEYSVDIRYLKTFTGADDALVKKLLLLFIKNVPTQLQELKQCITDDNLYLLPEAAHKLKSPFRYVGLEAVAERLEKIENYSTDIDIKALTTEVDELIAIGDNCVKQANELINTIE